MICCFRYAKRLFGLISLLFFSFFPLFAQPSTAMNLSDSLFESFSEQGFIPQKQMLVDGPSQTDYPYSIYIELENQILQTETQQLVFAIPQEIANTMKDQLIALIQNLKQTDLPVKVTFLLQADEFSRLPTIYTDSIPYGTQRFLSTISNPDDTVAILLSPLSNNKDSLPTVIFGSEGKLAPQWFVEQIPLNIAQSSLLTYRLDLAPKDTRLSAFLKEGIPAVSIQFDSSDNTQIQTVCIALNELAQNFSVEQKETRVSENYLFIPLPNSERLWIAERLIIVIYLIAGAIVLLIACGFSFGKKTKLSKQNEFLKTWYIIPITLLLSVLSLFLGQIIAVKLSEFFGNSPILILLIKTIFSFLFVSLLFIILLKFKIPLSYVIYGYLLTLISIMNIFIFSSIDLILIFAFIIEYIIIYVTRLTRRTIPLLIATLLMLIPFIPYAKNIYDNAETSKLMNLVATGFIGNLLYSMLLMPFQIMWLRILVRINVIGQHKKMSGTKIYMTYALFLIALLAILIGSVATIFLITDNQKENEKYSSENIYFSELEVINETDSLQKDELITINTTKQEYLDLVFITLDLKSELPILKYEVLVSSDNNTPVYDSYMSFEIVQQIDGSVQTLFAPPYESAQNTSFSFTADGNTNHRIEVTAYLQQSSNKALQIVGNSVVKSEKN
ncbi:MAG: hypothetical protein J6B81_02415 [Spirochaetaceae bacterium]|nr:hypothetical protein [Spirochaetaceae bacterium]